MRKQLLATLAAAFALTACESTNEEQKNSMTDWPAQTENSASNEAVAPGSAAEFKQSGKDRVHFATNKSHLSHEAHSIAAAQAEWLQKYSNVNVVVQGHCDARGSDAYNLALGERRAHSLKKDLVKHGVAANRIDVTSFGKSQPEFPGNDESAWALNRQAVTVVK